MCLSPLAQHPGAPRAVPRAFRFLVLRVPLKGQAKPTGAGAGLKLLQNDLRGK